MVPGVGPASKCLPLGLSRWSWAGMTRPSKSNLPDPGLSRVPATTQRVRRASSRAGTKSALHAPALARPATVVRDWCHVANGGDREAHGLQRPQRALTPRAGPADLDLQHFHPVLARLAASILGGHLSGVRRR